MTGHRGIVVRALTWNLYHGRDYPPDPSLFTWRSRLLGCAERAGGYAQVNRPLRTEFQTVLCGHEWEVALLQEAPPRWLGFFADRCRAGGASALTSRNSFAALRAAAAELNPDLVASHEGGSNWILLRAPWRLVGVAREELTRVPERRVLLLVRAESPEAGVLCAGCLHASRGPRAAARDTERAAALAVEWAGEDPLVLGGDFNVSPEEDARLYAWMSERHGFRAALADSIDQLLVRGLEPVVAPVYLPPSAREVNDRDGFRLRLSDHDVVVSAFGVG